FMAKEILAYRLNTIHNLCYYMHLMAEMRQAIKEDRFAGYRYNFYELQGKEVVV
ncbi:MAG: tRNA guanosine(34) transglycosylase Tgt, partial [Deltaproteobacteria bacterium]|nr:tRNA guanosine(34) transglycosylase Tgt [Deltaproteobacteria bacterium]